MPDCNEHVTAAGIIEGLGGTAVIIPYFQRAPGMLTSAIRSVFEQIDGGPVTIIVCDDGSPVPAVTDIADLTAAERGRVILIRQANAGAGAARNAALNAIPPDTEWIAFIDSDDRWRPNHLARSIEALQAGFDLCFSDAKRDCDRFTHFEQADLVPSQHMDLGLSPGLHRLDANFLTLNLALSPVSISTVVMRMSVLGDLRFRPIAVEDLMFWFEAALRRPRIAFDGTLQVLYGRGNITVTESWKAPAGLKLALMYHRIFKTVDDEFELSADQRKILVARMERSRRHFSMVILAQVYDRTIPSASVVWGFMMTDLRIVATLLSTAVIEAVRRLPFIRRAEAVVPQQESA